ncbi:MAG: regulatory iron-sulfur-containing complex subunit RicT [Myxococcota bacterium]|nr:regulatory iron-sulfur-containing complex subunit RicT [Myxococcota bacterium]
MSEEKRFAARARLHVIGENIELQTTSPLKRNDRVLVDTEQGRQLVTLIEDARTSEKPDNDAPMARRLTERDHEQLERMTERESDALSFAKLRANKLNLDLKFVSAKLAHDGKFATFYFTAPERVDFRTLVKDLAKRFSMRVEMRQVGVRDAARQVGGIGLCGRKLCCATHLPSFKPISIRLAKDQGLALNQQKLSGACGRLRCCLQYEHEVYSKALKSMPKLHKKVKTPKGIGKVRDLNILNGKVSVVFDDGEHAVYQADEVERYIPPNQPKGTKPNEPGSKAKAKRRPGSKPPTPKSDDKKVDSGESAPKKKRKRNRNKAKGQEQTSREQSQDATASVPKSQQASGGESTEPRRKRRPRRRKPKTKQITTDSTSNEPSS